MPLSITKTANWSQPAVQNVLKTATSRPAKLAVYTPVFIPTVKTAKPAKRVEPALIETKKTLVPGSRLKNVMGRGPIFTGKPLVMTPIPAPRDA